MGPLAHMIIRLSDPKEIIPLLEKLEGRHGAGRQVTLTPGTFRSLERMYVPEDFERLLADFMKESSPSTAAYFVSVVHKLVKDRNWTWLLLHPQLTDKQIHTTRRVLCSSPPTEVGCQRAFSLCVQDSVTFAISRAFSHR